MKNEENALSLNLQFFASEVEGDVETEVVEPDGADEIEEVEDEELGDDAEEDDGIEDGEEDETEDHVQTPEENAIYANMRRRAEAEAKRKYDSQLQAMNAQFASMFGGYTNPLTGQPIQSASDYLAAMAAQERQAAEAKMAEAGIDRESLNRLIENNPTVVQAKEAIRRANDAEAERMIHEDYRNILALDPTIGSEADVPNADGFTEAVQYTVEHPDIRLSDAYKIVNFDRLASNKVQGARQAAINSARSKEHLSKTGGLSAPSTGSEIPASELATWKEFFPDKSPKELKAIYNKAIKA